MTNGIDLPAAEYICREETKGRGDGMMGLLSKLFGKKKKSKSAPANKPCTGAIPGVCAEDVIEDDRIIVQLEEEQPPCPAEDIECTDEDDQ